MSTDRDAEGEPIDAPEAPDYDAPPEEALDLGEVELDDWQRWPTWAKIRLLRKLRTAGAGRPEQYIDPSEPWYIWALFGGRGSGKSLEANGFSAEEGLRLPRIRTALVGRTFGDVRDTIFEGETGLLAIIPDHELRGGSRSKAYNRSLGELYLANGSKFKGFSAEKPSALRGPQHHRAAVDEASSWEDADVPLVETKAGKAPAVDTTMSNLMLGLRLNSPDGSGVRMVSSTTPKPNELTDLIEDLAERKGVIRVLTTYSNLDNLAEEIRDVVLGMYEGTDVAAQELEGKILKQAKGAAWDVDAVARARARETVGDVVKRTLGIDPAVSSKNSSDETGLVVVSLEERVEDEEVLRGVCIEADLSGKVDVSRFGEVVIGAVEAHDCDTAVVEINNGYDFVVSAVTSYVEANDGTVIKRVRKDTRSVKTKSRVIVEYICETGSGHSFVLKPVWQSVDKLTRAKAASVWWHQGKARHGAVDLTVLEKQMTTFDGSGKKSPDRLDALSSAVAEFAGLRRGRPARGASPLDVVGEVDDAAPVDGPKHPLLEAADAPGRAEEFWTSRI